MKKIKKLKNYIVSFSGAIEVKAKDEMEAIDKVTNTMILDSVQFDEVYTHAEEI